MSKINVLIFGHGYNPPFVDVYNQYARVFDREQYHVTLVYLVGAEKAEIREASDADEVIFIDASAKTTRGLKWQAVQRLRALCREKNFAMAICHRYKAGYILALASLFLPIKHKIFVAHDVKVLKRLSRKLFVWLFMRKRFKFAGVSNAIRDDLIHHGWGLNQHNTITLLNSMDMHSKQKLLYSREQARQALHLDADELVFGNVGRLAPEKDQATLLRGFAKAREQLGKGKLIILGGGKLDKQLQQLANELGITEHVIFAGFVPDVFRYYAAFDIYVSTAVKEPFGIVFLEAMLAKLPIIATPCTGVPEVLGDNAAWVPTQAPAQLADTLVEWGQASEAQWRELGEKNYTRLQDLFSTEAFKQAFWDTLKEDPHRTAAVKL